MRIRFDKLDWKSLQENRRLKFNIGLAVVLIVFFVFFIDIIFSICRYKSFKEEIPKKTEIVKKAAVGEKPEKKPEKPEKPRPPAPVPAKKPAAIFPEIAPPSAKIAIILDDAGGGIPDYAGIYSIKERLTIAVIPDLGTSAKVAGEIAKKGMEVILHLPMESLNGSYTRKSSGMVTVSESDDQIKKTFQDDLASVKWAVGFNNHMGSKATADERVMKDVFDMTRSLPARQGKKLYFIDSRTTTRSVALKVARSCGVPSGENNMFLDSLTGESYVEGKFRELVALARQKGSAIGIGHATRPATIAALKKLMPEYEKRGIRFVFASELVK